MNLRQLRGLVGLCTISVFVFAGCFPPEDGENSANGNNRVTDPGDCQTFTDAYGSTIDSDTTVTADGCLRVDESIRVDAGLTLEPGTALYFAESAGLSIVGGSLSAAGTESDPILLTAQDESAGAWAGLSFTSDSAVNALDHVTIEYGGGLEDTGGLTLFDGSKVSIDNTTIRSSADVGLLIGNDVELSSFSSNRFADNGGAPLEVSPGSVSQLSESAEFEGNGEPFVRVKSATVSQGRHEWVDLGLPYRPTGNLKFSGGDTELTLQAGVTIEFPEQANFYVQGPVFVVDGEAGNEVVFTATNPIVGWWGGVTLHNTDRVGNRIEHAIIEYGGHESGIIGTTGNCLHCTHNPSNLQLHGNRGAVQVAINNTVLREGAAAGLYADENTTITSLENNDFSGNDGPPANVHPLNVGQLDNSSTFGSDVEIRGGFVDDGNEYTWPVLDARYVVSGGIRIEGGETRVNIDAGATYAFEEQHYLAVESAVFTVNGEEGNEVTFTGTNEQPGWWSGITIHNTDRAANTIDYAVIEYAGNDHGPLGTTTFCLHCTNHPSNLQLYGDRGAVTISLSNIELRNSSTLGVYVDDDVSIASCTDILFEGNATDLETNNATAESTFVSTCGIN